MRCCQTNGKIILNDDFSIYRQSIFTRKDELNIATKYIGWGGSEKVTKERERILKMLAQCIPTG